MSIFEKMLIALNFRYMLTLKFYQVEKIAQEKVSAVHAGSITDSRRQQARTFSLPA
jgi:hypothetical protein